MNLFDVEQFNIKRFKSKQVRKIKLKIGGNVKREETIGFIVRSLDNMMMRNAVGDDKSEKKGMMPVMQGWIIGYLYDHRDKEIFQRDIEAEFYIARSTVTCLVKQMEKKGYIARVAVERDCRLKRLCLLEKGEEIHERFLQNIDRVEEKIREGVSEEELQTFFKVATQIRDNLEDMQHCNGKYCGRKNDAVNSIYTDNCANENVCSEDKK